MKQVSTENPLVAVRKAGVPLCAIETADPTLTIDNCKTALKSPALDDWTKVPVIRWDMARGMQVLNDYAKKIAQDSWPMLLNPSEMLAYIYSQSSNDDTRKLWEGTVCFVLGAPRFMDPAIEVSMSFNQALWNLRDLWKATGGTLVLLGASFKLPAELTHDIVVVEEPLPGTESLASIVTALAKTGKVTEYDESKTIDTLRGLSGFAAEQALAMSITRDAKNVPVIDREMLWERKRKMVEQTPGLAVWRGGESFDDIGGLNNIKTFLKRVLTSPKNPVRAIGYIDEIEKLFAGASGDNTGVSQDQLQVFLTEMQNANIPGIILIGPPGTGKSALAKGAGRIADAEVVAIDTGAMKQGVVGSSEGAIRKAMQTFRAISQGKGLFIATCNSIASLPPELRRRFTLGTFYVDLPSAEERESIWGLWTKKYSLTAEQLAQRPEDKGWTGAEIKACCDVAYRTDMTLVEAATFIVPVSKSASDKIQALRDLADNRFISASTPGLFSKTAADTAVEAPQARKLRTSGTSATQGSGSN